MGDAFPNCHLVRRSRDHNYVQRHAELALVLRRVEAGNTQICSDCLNHPMPRGRWMCMRGVLTIEELPADAF